MNCETLGSRRLHHCIITAVNVHAPEYKGVTDFEKSTYQYARLTEMMGGQGGSRWVEVGQGGSGGSEGD